MTGGAHLRKGRLDGMRPDVSAAGITWLSMGLPIEVCSDSIGVPMSEGFDVARIMEGGSVARAGEKQRLDESAGHGRAGEPLVA